MPTPQVESLCEELKALLCTYNPWECVYLDAHGQWTGPPRTLRGRIANELWHQLYLASQNAERREEIAALIRPFIADRLSWGYTRRLYGQLTGRATDQSPLVAIVELCGCLLELAVLEQISSRYVPPWDTQGRQWASVCAQRRQEFLASLVGADERVPPEFLEGLSRRLAGGEYALTAETVRVVVHEEELRRRLEGLLRESPPALPEGQVLSFFGEQLSPALSLGCGPPQALLRPCLELLQLPSLPVASGLPYEAVNILSRLRDSRSAGTLRRLLATTPAMYTNLRCATIFALGCLRDPHACQLYTEILRGPDVVTAMHGDHPTAYQQPLHREKSEAIWALGKLEAHALPALSLLSAFAEYPDHELRVAAAWALGQIGDKQKQKQGGVDVEVVIALLRLLASRDPRVFEEAASALRTLGLPDFLHTLYLHDFSTIPILALKPCSTGLYELSETLFHLMSVRRPVVMAVTGDSGTGKTYFCQAIAQGFADLRAEDILYLMRDRPANATLNRILGLEWLRSHVDPRYYQDDSIAPEDDDPESYFDQFMQTHSHKRLIILDGWRDEAYFHRVIERFYERGFLDVIVSFRTTYSTRRLNLEQREANLESVSSHLGLIEDPPLERTRFYREGDVLVYNLDNSIPSRLSMAEIRQVFATRKVRDWVEHILIGAFQERATPLRGGERPVQGHTECFQPLAADVGDGTETHFVPEESSFSRVLPSDPLQEPHLLQTVEARDLEVERLAFYTHGQVAFGAQDGRVGIMIGFNDRLLSSDVHRSSVRALCVVGGDICSVAEEGDVLLTSFERSTQRRLPRAETRAVTAAPLAPRLVAVGYEDGSIALWELTTSKVQRLLGHKGPLLAAAADRRGRLYTVGTDATVRIWDLARSEVRILSGLPGTPQQVAPYPDGRVAVALVGNSAEERGLLSVVLLDPQTGEGIFYPLKGGTAIHTLTPYPDGRLFVGVAPAGTGASLLVVDPRPSFLAVAEIGGHALATTCCLAMGPRLITCGQELDGHRKVKIWGTTSYVRHEQRRLEFLSEGHARPGYYRTLF